MCKTIDSNLNGNNEHKKFTHLQKWLFKFKIIKFLFDNSPNDLLCIMIKITSCYISRDELNVLKKHEIIKNNARKLFLNNVLTVIAIVLSVYALISTVIEKKFNQLPNIYLYSKIHTDNSFIDLDMGAIYALFSEKIG